jgi:hypothetical protein
MSIIERRRDMAKGKKRPKKEKTEYVTWVRVALNVIGDNHVPVWTSERIPDDSEHIKELVRYVREGNRVMKTMYEKYRDRPDFLQIYLTVYSTDPNHPPLVRDSIDVPDFHTRLAAGHPESTRRAQRRPSAN